MKKILALLTMAAAMGCAHGQQLQSGHSWGNETVTAQKLNDTVNQATALPGLIGNQTSYTGTLATSDEVLLRRAATNTLVRVTVAQLQIPAGAVMQYAGSTAPTGWLLCDGSAVSRTTYANLFTAIGVTFGTGDGTTTFNLPDCRGRVVAGLDTQVSSAYALRLTATGTGTPGIDSKVLGAAGGVDRYALIGAQIPFPTLSLTTDNNFTKTGSSIAVTSGSLSFGSVQAHPIVQPTLVLGMIIKY
jgi:microcystin-dependent protein